MSASHISDSMIRGLNMPWSQDKESSLMKGEILLQTESHTAWGGSVTACMYLPLLRSQVWQQLTDYPRWVQYFPDITKSEVLSKGEVKRVYQAAQKTFLFFTAQVEIYLDVVELLGQEIQFRMQKGSFLDFTAILDLKDFGNGTLLAYQVKATPNIPIPAVFIQQAMNFELPANMRKMRQVLCKIQ
ncbi:SRPBCC family protein [Umezakia ovalisporum]|uniref:Cyclase n=2 Tax=Umezakia ovalisporum TaxID=75695 RepID=A0AA43GY33_9CYAN|nr:SRPBCC family protein [Umezakia ovalisporum]MDH6057372.1 cyclase [Umezakia ovalisporum FSS-43]MDH6063563.1 cyclase [Umezakia ovalisporum FSS-62]MDH6065990.1 cyclase [Umezakia ovalisporum APH033B]MDH6072488.1 cyclase [Umezakia ovalisporum CobakiLakeA]MDH6075553.1 cyclase [Umezakia ovalisporum CS-1034]